MMTLPPVYSQPYNEDKGLAGFRQHDMGGYLKEAQGWGGILVIMGHTHTTTIWTHICFINPV